MQRTFNPWNRARYPGGPPLPGRLTAGHRPLKASVVVRIHPRQPIPSSSSSSFSSSFSVHWADSITRTRRRTRTIFQSLGGEIASRLAYTQKSRGQNLPGRPAFALRATARRAIACRAVARSAKAGHCLPRRSAEREGGPRCIISSAPVSDTGGPGAIPGEAANFISTKNKHLHHRSSRREEALTDSAGEIQNEPRQLGCYEEHIL